MMEWFISMYGDNVNISQVSKLTQLSAKSIRLYEEKGLISPPQRSDNGYRRYTQRHIDQLTMVVRAKRVGFTLDECKTLVNLADDPNTTSADVKKRAEEKLKEVTLKWQELTLIKKQLEDWVHACPGDAGHHCPIIDDLKS